MTRAFNDLHVAVLMGGLSAEREVSLTSGEQCAQALERQGVRVSRVDAGRDLANVLSGLIRPDVVLNCLHGAWGEDGCVQGVLETLRIPYTHSGVLASALAMDKDKSKAVLKAAGVKVPGGGLYDRHEVASRHVIAPPYVVKPNAEGSSVGVYLVREDDAPVAEVGDPAWAYGEQVMVEPYIAGKELAVAVIGEKSGPRALTVTDITPTKGFYDYEAKYAPGGSVHVLPAVLPPAVFEAALRQAEAAHVAMGCQGVSRSDFRYDDVKDDLVLLEVNTQPGMTPTSLAPEQAAHTGMSYEELVRWMVEDASCPR
ncbi:D-alanine--D-alanine ligase [Brevundimonas intermedia]|uniref:D-alanine--D-alanine ligase n=1 Tax=Brevundimonas intermedia TaxID=74315 RepID=A0ABQ5T7E2_9CAUL|nr:D-alanine--D-alanine ligase [Brevundimonas intermedia]GLK48072.1 D-alanine--D-alanine ligase [Brevundimonas intermedia]